MKHPLNFVLAAGVAAIGLWLVRPVETIKPPAVPPAAAPGDIEELPAMDPEGVRLYENYQRTAEPMNRQLADAAAMRACELRSLRWFEGQLDAYWSKREKMLAALHAPDRPYAEEFDRTQIQERLRWRLSGSCEQMEREI